MDEQPKNTARQEARVYGAPRRFGIGTLLIVTTAFAVAVSILSALRFSPINLAIVLTFITLVGIAQAVLFGGKQPRLASVVAGFAALELFLCIGVAMSFSRTGRAPSIGSVLFEGTCIFAFLGPIYGYLAGGMVAGLFLVMDKIEQFLHRRKAPPIESDDPIDSA